MAAKRKKEGSIFSRLSIRVKLVISFILILTFIISLSLVSVNSSSVFGQNYNVINTQSELKEIATELKLDLEDYDAVVDDWLTNPFQTERDFQLEVYSDITERIEDKFNNMTAKIADIITLDTDNRVNTNKYQQNVSQILNSITEIQDHIDTEVFTVPGQSWLDQIVDGVHGMNLAIRNMFSSAIEYLQTNDTSSLAPIATIGGTGPEILNFQRGLSDVREAIAVIGTPEQMQETEVIARGFIAFLAQSINSEIFDNYFFNYYEAIDDFKVVLSEDVSDAITDILLGTTTANISSVITNFIDEVGSLDTTFEGILDYTSEIRNYNFLAGFTFSALNNLVQGQIDEFIAEIGSNVELLGGEFVELFTTQNRITLLVILMSLLVVAGVSIFINSSISNPIKSITYWSQLISDGDLSLTQEVSGRMDEIGRLQSNFRQMNRNLREIIDEVQTSSVLISDTSEDLATSSQEINATAEEVSAIAQTMAKGSTEQAEIITTIVQELQEASDVVENVVVQITENLDIIKDLSEQTNILALNTAIEAANAGQYARGFGVIAENIRKMSEESKRTSKRVSKDRREILEALRDSFNHISSLIENVASVSEETAASAEEVAASAEEMTASMENIAASSAILSDQSAESLDKVNRFKLD